MFRNGDALNVRGRIAKNSREIGPTHDQNLNPRNV